MQQTETDVRTYNLMDKLEGCRPLESVRKIIYETLGIELDATHLQWVHRALILFPQTRYTVPELFGATAGVGCSEGEIPK